MEEDVELELEAVEAVYGPDCSVLRRLPPLLQVALRPRTADDISQQFVEAVLVIQTSLQYPAEPPELELMDTKGLDEGRHTQLLAELRAQAIRLACSPMLVAICEEATDQLTNMNQPDGMCCFCMFPLVMEDVQLGLKPFMKLLSCFHCFHSDCFGRWWRWSLEQHKRENSPSKLLMVWEQQQQESGDCVASLLSQKTQLEMLIEELKVKCPICRKPLHAEDVLHVHSFLKTGANVQQFEEESSEVLNFFLTDVDTERRSRFDEHFKVQQSRGGIIEPKKLEVIMPGMFLLPTSSAGICFEPGQESEDSATSTGSSETLSNFRSEETDAGEQLQRSSEAIHFHQQNDFGQNLPQSKTLSSGDDHLAGRTGRVNAELHRKVHRPRQGRHAAYKQKVQWIKRERDSDS